MRRHGSFRLAVNSQGVEKTSTPHVFKTGAIDRSAIPPIDSARENRFGGEPYTAVTTHAQPIPLSPRTADLGREK